MTGRRRVPKLDIPGAQVVVVVRKCRKCQRWRSIGNFSFDRYKGKLYVNHNCRRCLDELGRWRGGIYWPVKSEAVRVPAPAPDSERRTTDAIGT